jgi:hypothetical protein
MSYPGVTYPYSPVCVDNSRNVYVTGSNTLQGTSDDIILIKYSQIDGIKSISNSVPEKFKLHQNYPNPFNNSTIIKFEVLQYSKINLEIFDINGKLEERLINGQYYNRGSYEYTFINDNLSSGIYFYRLEYNQQEEKNVSKYLTKKMILIK